MAVAGTFVFGCAVFLVVGCAGTRSEAPKEQAHTEVTKEQAEEDRCEGTRTFQKWGFIFTTNDVPNCPKGGLLSGTDGPDKLFGREGEDEIRALGAADFIPGGAGSDVIYGGPGADTLWGGLGEDVIYGGDGDDEELIGDEGEDVIYGGKGNDFLDAIQGDSRQADKLYCGEGTDEYNAGKGDYVSSSCEEQVKVFEAIP